jgi:hypothetical protein
MLVVVLLLAALRPEVSLVPQLAEQRAVEVAVGLSAPLGMA